MRTLLSLLVLSVLGCGDDSGPPGTVVCRDNSMCGDDVCIVNRCFPPGYTGSHCDFIMCGANATCSEGPPVACSCNAGFSGDGITCTSGDECMLGTDDCSANATCTDTPTGFDCTCNMGYVGDGRTCMDEDECMGGMPCDTNATCMNSEGSFMCMCNMGWTGDGLTCADENECDAMPCGMNAECTNTDGSYTCACSAGFFGDGMDCRPSIGQVIWIGHDYFSRNADVDRVIGNAVAQATTLGDITVLGYQQFADLNPGGERDNANAAIMARITELGRTATITPVDDYMMLPAMLPAADVLLIYEMEGPADPVAVGTALATSLHEFIDAGGVIVVNDHFSGGWQILNTAGVMRFVGSQTQFADTPCTVTVPDDPVMADVSPMYTGTDGTTNAWTTDGRVLAVADGLPVVVHHYDRLRFTGTFGAAWEMLAPNPEAGYSLMTYFPRHLPELYNLYDATGQRYNPGTNTWTNLTTSSGFSEAWTQFAPIGQYLIGFRANTTNVHRYDTRTDTWAMVATHTGTNEYSMAVADRAGFVYGHLNDGRLMRLDPRANTISYLVTTSGRQFEPRLAYDPETNSIFFGAYDGPNLYQYDLDTSATTMRTRIPEPQLNDIFCSDNSGHIYVAGDSSGTTLFQYTIATDTWTPLPGFPADHGNNGTCAVSDDGWLYVSSGGGMTFARLSLERTTGF